MQIYRSDDVGAPTLIGGSKGSLITLLDACLVNGYGSKPAAGWTKPFSGTNTAAYRMSTVAPSTGAYLYIDDNATDGRVVRYVGYTNMSSISEGTGKVPMQNQYADGFYFLKDINPNSTTIRPWIVLAENRMVFIIVYADLTLSQFGLGSGQTSCIMFGDAIPRSSNNQFFLINQGDNTWNTANYLINNAGSTTGYVSKTYPFITNPKTFTKGPFGVYTNAFSSYFGQNIANCFPDLVTGEIVMSKTFIFESRHVLGEIPGLYYTCGGRAVGESFSTFSGTGNLAGKIFIQIPIGNFYLVTFSLSNWYS